MENRRGVLARALQDEAIHRIWARFSLLQPGLSLRVRSDGTVPQQNMERCGAGSQPRVGPLGASCPIHVGTDEERGQRCVGPPGGQPLKILCPWLATTHRHAVTASPLVSGPTQAPTRYFVLISAISVVCAALRVASGTLAVCPC